MTIRGRARGIQVPDAGANFCIAGMPRGRSAVVPAAVPDDRMSARTTPTIAQVYWIRRHGEYFPQEEG
jgi:hypothetical protein